MIIILAYPFCTNCYLPKYSGAPYLKSNKFLTQIFLANLFKFEFPRACFVDEKFVFILNFTFLFDQILSAIKIFLIKLLLAGVLRIGELKYYICMFSTILDPRPLCHRCQHRLRPQPPNVIVE